MWRKENLAQRFLGGKKTKIKQNNNNKPKPVNKFFKKASGLLVNSMAFIMTYDAEFYTNFLKIANLFPHRP